MPVGDDGYFQTATWTLETPDLGSFRLEFRFGEDRVLVDPSKISSRFNDSIDLAVEGAVRVELDQVAKATAELVKGKVVVTDLTEPSDAEGGRRAEAYRRGRDFQARMATLGASLIVSLDPDPNAAAGFPPGRLIDPNNPKPGLSNAAPKSALIGVHDPAAIALFEKAAAPLDALKTTLKLGKPVPRPVKLKNVVGLLPGSDPMLKDTYVLVTAHYDHVGIGAASNGDQIYNGANDDGSGTVSSSSLPRPWPRSRTQAEAEHRLHDLLRRGKGLLGLEYYGRHPIFPIEKTSPT